MEVRCRIFFSPLFFACSLYFFQLTLLVLFRSSFKFKLSCLLNLNLQTGLLVNIIMLLHSLLASFQRDCLAIVYLWEPHYIHQKPFIGMNKTKHVQNIHKNSESRPCDFHIKIFIFSFDCSFLYGSFLKFTRNHRIREFPVSA